MPTMNDGATREKPAARLGTTNVGASAASRDAKNYTGRVVGAICTVLA